jgi:ribosomal protein L11 methyltransferase
MSDYIEIRGTIPEAVEDGLAESLSLRSVLGVRVEPRGNGLSEVGVWVREGEENLAEEIRVLLGALGAGAAKRFSREAEDWSARWRRRLVAFEVGQRWWIDPHPDDSRTAPAGRIRIAVEPRAAFGSGTHESTQLVMMHLEDLDLGGLVVLDIGTGSGVLAVAADRLGAALVVAVDTDRMAAWEARATAARQSWPCRPLVVAGSVACLEGTFYDLVLCNMILTEFGPFLNQLPPMLSPGGSVLLSGILECERCAVESMLDDCGMTVVESRELRGWISLRAASPETR